MNQTYERVAVVVLFTAAVALLAAGCEQVGGPVFDGDSCVGCHTDEELLKEIADPIETSESSGEG